MPIDYSKQIETVDTIDYDEFQERFYKPQIPVKIKNLLSDAKANKKWSPEFLKEQLPDLEVGVFENDPELLDRSQKTAPKTMLFGNYIDKILSGPSDARLHLFNVFKHLPELTNDFEYPDIADRIVTALPFAFIGGEGSVARLHRDMDNANVFLTEFWGRKKVILFSPEYDELLYRFPFATHSPVDVENPDYDQYPGLHLVEGQHTILEKGETLFMPCKYWHHIRYLSVGIGMSFRSLGSVPNTAEGLLQTTVLSTIDDLARVVAGDDWQDYKTQLAMDRAETQLSQTKYSIG